jgi:hypothetical protein
MLLDRPGLVAAAGLGLHQAGNVDDERQLARAAHGDAGEQRVTVEHVAQAFDHHLLADDGVDLTAARCSPTRGAKPSFVAIGGRWDAGAGEAGDCHPAVPILMRRAPADSTTSAFGVDDALGEVQRNAHRRWFWRTSSAFAIARSPAGW